MPVAFWGRPESRLGTCIWPSIHLYTGAYSSDDKRYLDFAQSAKFMILRCCHRLYYYSPHIGVMVSLYKHQPERYATVVGIYAVKGIIKLYRVKVPEKDKEVLTHWETATVADARHIVDAIMNNREEWSLVKLIKDKRPETSRFWDVLRVVETCRAVRIVKPL